MYLLSLILGLAAWALPVAAMCKRKNFTGWSFSLCAVSLYVQICQNNVLVKKGDWAAIEDTYPAIAFAAAVLMSVTAVLNLVAVLMARKK